MDCGGLWWTRLGPGSARNAHNCNNFRVRRRPLPRLDPPWYDRRTRGVSPGPDKLALKKGRPPALTLAASHRRVWTTAWDKQEGAVGTPYSRERRGSISARDATTKTANSDGATATTAPSLSWRPYLAADGRGVVLVRDGGGDTWAEVWGTADGQAHLRTCSGGRASRPESRDSLTEALRRAGAALRDLLRGAR